VERYKIVTVLADSRASDSPRPTQRRKLRGPRRLTETDYAALAQVRYEIRRFLNFSETMARAIGVEPQQHQLLLAMRSLPENERTIGALAERLQIRHHSLVELASRSEKSGLVRRATSERDRREVTLLMTPRGKRLLTKLSLAHRAELRSAAPKLLHALGTIVGREVSDAPPRRKGR
jgi:DNA-binding MarR family transcriptional regulator